MNVPQFIHFITDVRLGDSQVWDITNNATRNIIADVFGEHIYIHISIGYIPRRGIANHEAGVYVQLL